MLRIRMGFIAGPESAFCLNVDPDPSAGIQTNGDLYHGQALTPQKVKFWHKIIIIFFF